MDRFVSGLLSETPYKERGIGTVTVVRATAEFQAKLIGGFVVRRDKRGRFSKHGTKFQAIRRKKR